MKHFPARWKPEWNRQLCFSFVCSQFGRYQFAADTELSGAWGETLACTQRPERSANLVRFSCRETAHEWAVFRTTTFTSPNKRETSQNHWNCQETRAVPLALAPPGLAWSQGKLWGNCQWTKQVTERKHCQMVMPATWGGTGLCIQTWSNACSCSV